MTNVSNLHAVRNLFITVFVKFSFNEEIGSLLVLNILELEHLNFLFSVAKPSFKAVIIVVEIDPLWMMFYTVQTTFISSR